MSGRPKDTLPGMSFSTFRQVPAGSNIVTPLPAAPPTPSMEPLPPQVVSNYRRPDYEPPLFLAGEVDGRRELLYSFLLAFAAPIVAYVHIYGLAMVFGGIYCSVVAIQRGRKLAILALVLNILAVPAAFLLYIGLSWFK
jgi:hypothetical protein